MSVKRRDQKNREPKKNVKLVNPRNQRRNADGTTKPIAKILRAQTFVHARHILFQVTPGVDVAQLRARAESTLAELLRAPAHFSSAACELSNWPSGQQGGNLGQIGRGDMVPEFEKALFHLGPTGILREVVRTRHGFHIVSWRSISGFRERRCPSVREQIAEQLKASVQERRQYVSILAGQAEIIGVDLARAQTPLVLQ